MTHLAIDLGSTNHISEGVLFDPTVPEAQRFITFPTTRAELSRICTTYNLSMIIIESCRPSHWVAQHLDQFDVDVFIADTNTEDFRLAKRRRKTDRLDAERLRTLFLLGKLKRVHRLSASSQELRQYIDYRRGLVDQRTQYKNRIRMLADRVGLAFRPGSGGWTNESLNTLSSWVDAAPDGVPSGSWQNVLRLFLQQHEHLTASIREADQVLAQLSNDNQPIEQVSEIPGVGPLTGAALVAVIDDPLRFENGKQVSRYSGYDPVPYESGKKRGTMGVSRRNWATFRNYLYEACMIGIHRVKDPWMRKVYEHIAHKTGSKRKAICAVARRVFVKAWRMLRYGQSWATVTGANT